MALLDWLGLTGGNALDPAGINAGIGMLDPETLKRLQRAAGMSAQDAVAANPLAVPPPSVGNPASPILWDPVRQAMGLGGASGITAPPVVPGAIGDPAGAIPTPIPAPVVTRPPGYFGGGSAVPDARSIGLLYGAGSDVPPAAGYGGMREAPPEMLENKPKETKRERESRREPVATAGGTSIGPANLFGGIGDFLGRHSNLFLGLGAGFGGARSIGQGLGRASIGVQEGAKADIEQQGYDQTINLLKNRGFSQADAEAIASQPQFRSQIMSRLFPLPKFGVIGEDPITGAKKYGVISEGMEGVATSPTMKRPAPGTIQKDEESGKRYQWMGGQWWPID